MTTKEFAKILQDKLTSEYGVDLSVASHQQIYRALALICRQMMSENHKKFQSKAIGTGSKQVYYLCMEFLMGRSLKMSLFNLGLNDAAQKALAEADISLDSIYEEEPDAGLGNGGLGRLAACYLDSMTTLEIPATGYSICYELGIFKQKIIDGKQVELADNWLGLGDAWLIAKMDEAEEVRFGGRIVDHWVDGHNKPEHVGYTTVLAIPRDMEIAGYKTNHTNTLRLWDAKSPVPVDMSLYSRGEYLKAVEQQAMAEVIAKVLYPDDNHYEGKSLRLKQQYFFVSATAQSIVRQHRAQYGTLRNFHQKHVIQINDTHPTMVIPELIRLLVERGLDIDEAIDVVSRTCAYTNHTILAEALEKWPIGYLKKVVPQLVPIIEILDDKVRRRFSDESTAIIDRNDTVHMAHIDIHYGFSVNGVAALHTDILKQSELNHFYKIYPDKFNNKTNGITFRRWLLHCNPRLTALLDETIKDEYKEDASKLVKLLEYKDDETVLKRLLEIKKENKKDLAAYLKETQAIEIDADTIFDIQVKRLHEYKRQQLNALYIIDKYLEIKEGILPKTPITAIFGAKAAPAYVIAKDIIHLILCLQEIINNDPEVSPYLKVVMVENYNVTKAEKLIPACDISEQISLASKEASGTGNMKFMLNGAVTLGTEDGANVEIHELVGDDNIFVFGASSDEVIEHYKKADYSAKDYYKKNPKIKAAVDFITEKQMMKIGCKESLERLQKELIGKDWFMTFLDFDAYKKAKDKALAAYTDQKEWAKKMLVNIAEAGYFSSDRTIEQYNRDIWKLTRS